MECSEYNGIYSVSFKLKYTFIPILFSEAEAFWLRVGWS